MKQQLVVDIGNTHTVAGLYAGDRLVTHLRFKTDSSATPDEYRAQLAQLFAFGAIEVQKLWSQVERVILATVVPPLDPILRRAAKGISFLSINAESKREFELDLPNPSQLGADRLANVAGALRLLKAPFLIVDAGTATTFCMVDSDGKYFGGAITPGLEISWKALQARAAKLYAVELKRPANPVGNTTETQIQSGVIHGYEALIEGMVDRLLEQGRKRGTFTNPTLIATGGCVQGLELTARFRREPELTLLGLLQYGEWNA